MSNLIALPQSLNDFMFGNPNTRIELQNILADASYFPAHSVCGLLFHGPYGSGKTTLANWLTVQLERRHDPATNQCLYKTIQCIGEPSAKAVMSKLEEITQTSTRGYNISGVNYILLDDVDTLSAGAMKSLRGFMTTTAHHTIYLMTANHIADVDKGVRDRSHVLAMPSPSLDQWVAFGQPILQTAGVVITDAALASVLIHCEGSWRRVLGALDKIIALEKSKVATINIRPSASPMLTAQAIVTGHSAANPTPSNP